MVSSALVGWVDSGNILVTPSRKGQGEASMSKTIPSLPYSEVRKTCVRQSGERRVKAGRGKIIIPT